MRKRYQVAICILSVFIMFFIVVKKILFPNWVHTHNQKLLESIKKADTKNYLIFSKFITDIESQTEWKVFITSSYRTIEEQQILKREDNRNAQAGQSKHNFAKAIDINLYKNSGLWGKWILKSTSQKYWDNSGVIKIAEKHNLRWGGTFKNYYDPVHFEIQ